MGTLGLLARSVGNWFFFGQLLQRLIPHPDFFDKKIYGRNWVETWGCWWGVWEIGFLGGVTPPFPPNFDYKNGTLTTFAVTCFFRILTSNSLPISENCFGTKAKAIDF